MNEPVGAAQLADEIARARDALAGVARRCAPEQWRASPLDGDARPVGVVIDHVADSYRYLGRFVRQLLDDEPMEVNAEVIDALNARHAGEAATVTREQAIQHLQDRGDVFASLIRSLSAADLKSSDGRVGRFALIAIRHADNHRAEIEAVLAATSSVNADRIPPPE